MDFLNLFQLLSECWNDWKLQTDTQKKEEGRGGGADRRHDLVANTETEELLSLVDKHPTVSLMLLVRTGLHFPPSDPLAQLSELRRRIEALLHIGLIGNSEPASW